MAAVSVIIPNYNGQALLAQHLPAVLRTMRAGDQLVVIDDHSTDDSWSWLTQFFQAQPDHGQSEFDGERQSGIWQVRGQRGQVLLLRNQDNQRFGRSCNLAVQLAAHQYIFLINSDVAPQPGVIDQLLTHFGDPRVFAVGCMEHEQSAQGELTYGGKNQLAFQRGLFTHARASEFSSGPTAWASGGSSMFDRQKWLALGGFDPAYHPAYWEDVDLSFRAKQRGWQVLFDDQAVVDHNHESTNRSAFGQRQMQAMSWQHAQTFTWRHANWWQKLQYLIWQPYWWLRGPALAPLQLQLIAVGLVFLLAAALRFFQLGAVPHGLAWDEAAIGYNGWSVAHTWRDEWLQRLPISFRSFGDYKAPLAIYLVGLTSRFLELDPWSIRLPFALAGVAAVGGFMWLVKLLWQEWQPRSPVPSSQLPKLGANQAAILAGFFLAVSPWHLHYSRVAFESGLALSLLIWGMATSVWLLTRSHPAHGSRQPAWQWGAVAVSTAGLWAATLYAYHSSKVVLPLLILAGIILCGRQVWRQRRQWLVVLMTLTVLLLPLLIDTAFGRGGDRFQQASIFRTPAPISSQVWTLSQHFLRHFQPDFLIGGQTDTLRHGSGQYGVLQPTELLLVMAALLAAGWQWRHRQRAVISLGVLAFAGWWVVAGTLPAAIGVDVPHSNRMLLALPGFILLALLGWQWLADRYQDGLWAAAILGTTFLLHSLLSVSYVSDYYQRFAAASAADFKDGYLEAVQYARRYEDQVDKILFTNRYQQAYIYALLGRQTSVYDYHNGSLIKYEFSDKITVGDLLRANTLIIATPAELDPQLGQYLVKGSDGQVRFVIRRTP